MHWGEDPWVPPHDPRRPTFPYHVGSTLSIQRHVPPLPFGRVYYPDGRPEAKREECLDMTRTDLCLRFPPQELEAKPASDLDTSVSTIHITAEPDCRDDHGPQVVCCYLNNDKTGTTYVAKIFDAMYYPNTSAEFGDPLDITWLADRDYSCEAAAYDALCQAGVNGRYSPKYYGSWTFNVPVPAHGKQPATSRSVRMILIEWIQGSSMVSYLNTGKVNSISPVRRLELLAKAMENNCYLLFHGVSHLDFAPRNIVIRDSDSDSLPSIYTIDFNLSLVLNLSSHTDTRLLNRPLPASPMQIFWWRPFDQFGDWVPKEYQDNEPAFRGWLKKRWGQSKDFFLVDDPSYEEEETVDLPLNDT